MSTDEESRLVPETGFQINPLLPDKLRMFITASPPMIYTANDNTESCGICTDIEAFKSDFVAYRDELRIIFTTAERYKIIHKQDFQTRHAGPANEENAERYLAALDRMLYHKILVEITIPMPEETIQLYEPNQRLCPTDKKMVTACVIGWFIGFLVFLTVGAIIYIATGTTTGV
jgi:hypothetical protein